VVSPSGSTAAARVLVIHRDLSEAAERAARLRDQGWTAEVYASLGAKGFRGIRANPPAVALIDLTRLPSYGKAMGVLLRQSPSLRAIPLVFIEGDPEKTAGVREILPDAVIAPWPRIAAAIRRAIAQAPKSPLPPRPSGTSLATKLGIRRGSLVALVRAPEGFEAVLGPLPEGAGTRKQTGEADVVLMFFKSAAALGRELPALPSLMRKGRKVWVLWPKQASAHAGDLTMVRIREMASPFGLVDYKVCAVDATWSGIVLGLRRGK
jgi:hypothetical protein